MISLPVTIETEDAISNFLFELGAQGCVHQEQWLYGYFSSSDWNQDKVEQLRIYLQQLAELQFSVHPESLRIEELEDQDWNAAWKKNLTPITIGHTFIIKPTWIDIPADPSLHVIEIDPQMAFGTGFHATTQLMLRLLIKYLDHPTRILDMGTGTGILAIACAKLCPATIVAFDNDPIATATALNNCRINRVADHVQIFCGTIDGLKPIQFDLLLANINRSTIVESLPTISRHLTQTGRAIFSGILIDEIKLVQQQLLRHGFHIITEEEQDEWAALVVTRSAP